MAKLFFFSQHQLRDILIKSIELIGDKKLQLNYSKLEAVLANKRPAKCREEFYNLPLKLVQDGREKDFVIRMPHFAIR